MTYSTFQGDDSTPLVLDTSVLVNLHASKIGAKILSALPNKIIVPEIVAAELEHETSKRNGEHRFVKELVEAQNVLLAALDRNEEAIFHSLVSGNPSLDDGESATIAITMARNYIAVIDERKGRLQAQALSSGNQPIWSLDLFRNPEVTRKLGEMQMVDALFHALCDGRMRVDQSHCDYVVRRIGIHRAILCKSLPSYKVRLQGWKDAIANGQEADIGSYRSV